MVAEFLDCSFGTVAGCLRLLQHLPFCMANLLDGGDFGVALWPSQLYAARQQRSVAPTWRLLSVLLRAAVGAVFGIGL